MFKHLYLYVLICVLKNSFLLFLFMFYTLFALFKRRILKQGKNNHLYTLKYININCNKSIFPYTLFTSLFFIFLSFHLFQCRKLHSLRNQLLLLMISIFYYLAILLQLILEMQLYFHFLHYPSYLNF